MSKASNHGPPADVALLNGIPYGVGGGRLLLLDLARPRQSSPKLLPAVVFIHGGGWMRADRSNGLPLITLLAEHGFVAVSIDYRLSGEAGFPAQLEDAKCAVRFLRAFAASYGLDPERIGVAGGSAGGHLAALVGLVPDDAGLEGNGGWPTHSSRVSAVADLYGISDLAALVAEGPAKKSALLLMRGTPTKKPALYRRASPLEWVRPGAPPFYLAHGGRDELVPPSHSEKLAASLRAAGAEVTLRIVPDMDHGTIATLPKIVRTDLVKFFKKHLGPPPMPQ